MDGVTIREFLAETYNRLTTEAPAKVNLHLSVGGLRGDGFHEIETVMRTITLSDTITVGLSDYDDGKTAAFTDCPGLDVPPEKNLAHRAACAFIAAAREVSGIYKYKSVFIALDKRIPQAAGLGGGSSDAAATLLLLNRLFDTLFTRAELSRIAAGLGCDVPFFLTGGTAVCTGVGEVVEPFRASECGYSVLLAKPRSGVSAGAAYAALDSAPPVSVKPSPAPLLHALAEGGDTALMLYNDFERVSVSLTAESAEIKSAMLAFGAESAMLSGSGSAVFSLFRNRENACSCRDRLKSMPGTEFAGVYAFR